MTNIKEMVNEGKKVRFRFYKLNELWYQTENGFDFPVPIEDIGDAIFLAEDKAILFMRWIKKHIKYLEDSKSGEDYTPLVVHPTTIVHDLANEPIKIDQSRGYGSVEETVERMNKVQDEPYDEMDDYGIVGRFDIPS